MADRYDEQGKKIISDPQRFIGPLKVLIDGKVVYDPWKEEDTTDRRRSASDKIRSIAQRLRRRA